MSASMARQGGRVQLEQSDMRLALNRATMAKDMFSRAAIEDTPFFIKKPRAEVRNEKKRGVGFPGHKNVDAAMDRHLETLRGDQTDGFLCWHNGIAHNSQPRWRHKSTRAPPLERLRHPTPEAMPHPPTTSPVPPIENEAAPVSETNGVPPGYVYIHTPLPSAQCCNLDGYAMDRKLHKDCNPDLLTDKGTSTG